MTQKTREKKEDESEEDEEDSDEVVLVLCFPIVCISFIILAPSMKMKVGTIRFQRWVPI